MRAGAARAGSVSEGSTAGEWTVPGCTTVRALGKGGFGRVAAARHDTTGSVSVVSRATSAQTATIPTASLPFGVALNAAGTTAYVGELIGGLVVIGVGIAIAAGAL
jgi:YVTN family beta-propeller protein